MIVTAGQCHESTQLEAVLDGIRVPRLGRGRPRTRPDRLLGDKASSYPRCRHTLRRRGIRSTIPTRRNQRRRRFAVPAYRRRNVVERCINRLKHFRGLATRYEKRAVNYRAMVIIASIMLWINS